MVFLDQFKHLRAHQQRILQVIEKRIPDLFILMEELDIIPDCFLNGWLLSLMSNCIPIEHMPEILSEFMKKGWASTYRLVVTYLLYLKERLLFSQDQA